MDKILSWDTFHVNRVSQLSDRQPLLLVGLTALNHFGLLHTFGIEQDCAVNFLRAVEHHYLCATPLATSSTALQLHSLPVLVS